MYVYGPITLRKPSEWTATHKYGPAGAYVVDGKKLVEVMVGLYRNFGVCAEVKRVGRGEAIPSCLYPAEHAAIPVQRPFLVFALIDKPTGTTYIASPYSLRDPNAGAPVEYWKREDAPAPAPKPAARPNPSGPSAPQKKIEEKQPMIEILPQLNRYQKFVPYLICGVCHKKIEYGWDAWAVWDEAAIGCPVAAVPIFAHGQHEGNCVHFLEHKPLSAHLDEFMAHLLLNSGLKTLLACFREDTEAGVDSNKAEGASDAGGPAEQSEGGNTQAA